MLGRVIRGPSETGRPPLDDGPRGFDRARGMIRPGMVARVALMAAALVIAGGPVRAAPPEVAVIPAVSREPPARPARTSRKAAPPAQEAPREPADGLPWVAPRLAALVAERLELAGLPARDARHVRGLEGVEPAALGLAVLASIRADPPAPADPGEALVITLSLRTGPGAPASATIRATSGALDPLAADLAARIAEAAGAPLAPSVIRALAELDPLPFPIHRLLGQARAQADTGEPNALRRAMATFDRASDLLGQGPLPEALEGRRLAEAELASRGETELFARAELAAPAAERAEVALKGGDDREAERALGAYLRYTEARTRRWTVLAPLDRPGAALLARGQTWVLQVGLGDGARWSIDPRTGVVLARAAGLAGLAGSQGDHAVVLDGSAIARVDEAGRTKWRVELPFRPRSAGPAALELTSGLAGVLGERDVAWVEASFGALGQVASQVVPLASGPGGVVAAGADATEVQLLRPGKRAPAWTAPLGAPRAAAITADRILVLSSAGLSFLRAHDGKEAARTLPIAADARILGAEGRYAAIAVADGSVVLADVLAGELTATVRVPARPVASQTTTRGVAILCASGDVLFFDRDGALLDRAVVPGAPIGLLAGSPVAPGPVVVTSRGLFALGEVPEGRGRLQRDHDALLELARILDRKREQKAALRVVTAVAASSAGRTVAAEALRAELLERRGGPGDRRDAERARARAEAARDPARVLPPFTLGDGAGK